LQKCLTNTERALAMNDFCVLIELTESDLYEVSGGSRYHKGSSIKVDVDVDIDFKVISKPTTTIDNAVDNSVNIGNSG
jgi:hypothetical protein